MTIEIEFINTSLLIESGVWTCCKVQWHLAGKISCSDPCDSRAEWASWRRTSAVCPLRDGEGGQHCPWLITGCSESSSPSQPQMSPDCVQWWSQPSFISLFSLFALLVLLLLPQQTTVKNSTVASKHWWKLISSILLYTLKDLSFHRKLSLLISLLYVAILLVFQLSLLSVGTTMNF